MSANLARKAASPACDEILETPERNSGSFDNTTKYSVSPKRATTAIMASSVDAKLLKSTKFPPEFSQKVDMQKVNVEVMKK